MSVSPVISDPEYRKRHRRVLAISVVGAVAGVLAFGFGGGRLSSHVDKSTSLSRDIAVDQQARVLSDRKGCERQNVLASNQAFGLAQNVEQTRSSLRKPGGLGPLESFREQIADGLKQRERGLRELEVPANAFPDRHDKYRQDCARAYPLP